MPLQDHFRPPLFPRRKWTSFHGAWATSIAAAINRLLPAGYYAEPLCTFVTEIHVAAFDEADRYAVSEWIPSPPDRRLLIAAPADAAEVRVYRTDDGVELAGSIELVSPSNKDRPAEREAFVSNPGKYHRILAELAGEWTFNGRHFSGNPNPDSNKVVKEFSGNIVRRPFANGRFFIVELTGGITELPIQDGRMKEGNVQDIETEGYDNVKRKFVFTFINNHIGSFIIYAEGSYDSTTRTISYEYEVEPVPGRKIKFRKFLIIQDNDRYTVEYYREQNGTMIKTNARDCMRVKGK